MAKGAESSKGESAGASHIDHDITELKDSVVSWVVCAGLFFMLFLSLGYIRVFGILFVAFQAEFSSSASLTASIMGVYAIVYSVTSLLACNVLLERFSARQIAMIGGVLVSGGVALDVFATSVDYLMLTNGIIVGIGNALIYGPSIVVLGMYFEKRRTLATAVAFCGASVGGIVLPPLIRLILDEYGVQGAMLIYGGILLNIVPAAMLLVPPKRMAMYMNIEKRKRSTRECTSMEERAVLYSKPYHVEVHAGSDMYNRTLAETAFSRLSRSLCDLPVVTLNGIAEKRVSNESNVVLYEDADSQMYKSLPTSLDTCDERNYTNSPCTDVQMFEYSQNENDDRSSNADGKRKRLCDLLAQTMDLSLLKIPLFCVFIGVHIFGYAAIVTFPSFVPPMAKDNGIGDVEGALLVSLHAGLDVGCRIATGVIADTGWIQRYRMLAIAYILLGTTYQFVRFYTTFTLMVLYMLIFGLFSGCFYSLHPSIAVDFFGNERFAKVFGYVQFFHGVVITASYPIIGNLRDITGDYAASCHFLGVSCYIAAVLLFVKPLFSTKKLEER